MAVDERGTAVGTVGASAAPSIVLPAGILGGELIRVTIGWNNGNVGVTCTTPAGFTLLDTGAATTASVAMFYKIAAGTVGAASTDAGATVTATLSVSKAWTAIARAFTGNDTVNPIPSGGHKVLATTAASQDHAAPTLTIATAGCWIEEGVLERGSSTVYTAPAGCNAHQASAGPQAVTGQCLIASADTGATVTPGTAGGHVWHGDTSSSFVMTWAVAIQPPQVNPTTAFGAQTTGGYTAFVDATASAAIPGRTITAYDWNWGDGSAHGSGVTAEHSYSAAGAGTYTITLTVTDSASSTSTATVAVTVQAPGAAAVPLGVLAPGYTPTGGTELQVFTDTSEATFDTSPGLPTAVVKTYFFPELAAPIAGQGLFFETLKDRVNSSSGSFTAKLYQDQAKTVLISTVTGISIPDGTSSASHPDSANTPPIFVNFPPGDVAAMTDFSTPTVETTETAA